MLNQPVVAESRKFCIIQVLAGLRTLSALQNSEVSAFRSILKYCINSASVGTTSSGHISEVAAIGRHALTLELQMSHICDAHGIR